MARPSPSTLQLLVAVLALALPTLVAAAAPQALQHRHALHQHAHSPLDQGHARRAAAVDNAHDYAVDYHRMRLMPRQSNPAAGGAGGGGSSDDEAGDGSGSGLSSGRGVGGMATPTNAVPSSPAAGGGGSNGQASNTANNPPTSNTNPANNANAPPSDTASASQSTGGERVPLGNVGSGISSATDNGQSSSTTDPVAAASSTSEAIAPVTTDTTPLDTDAAVDPNLAASSSTSDTIDNITLTQTVSASETSETAVPEETAAEANQEETKSSGVSKSAIIIIIVVASCVGGAIAIWTIIRKVKLSPSSRFNRKLAPIDFSNNRRDSEYFNALGSVDNLSKAAGGGTGSPPNGMMSDKDDGMSWPLHHSPSQSSHGHHDRQDSNEKIGGGMYGSIAPALPPPSSTSGSLRRDLTMASIHSNGAVGMGLNRADSMASSAPGTNGPRSDSGHQQQYQGFYPGVLPPIPQASQAYHQTYAPQFQQQQHSNAALNYSNSMSGYGGTGLDYSHSMSRQGDGGLDYSDSTRRPGGYEAPGRYEY